ncbi:hypothetical protein LSCM4_01768 [Leishmania orientalis]|uniref:Uncharacterized protein n=1 Tax=Leishmania orientalis TaxID=2249476 RepID=A0A836KKM9_9TRYP|nr:hypothetical protein LSCM4_01768 [Leishmania orientalis]
MGYRRSPAFLRSFNYTPVHLNVCLVFYLARLYVYVSSKVRSFMAAVTPFFMRCPSWRLCCTSCTPSTSMPLRLSWGGASCYTVPLGSLDSSASTVI